MPPDDDMAPLIGYGPELLADRTACGGDVTLDDRYHRDWSIALVDMAGHVVRGPTVESRPEPLGCSTSGGAGAALAWLVAGAAVGARRRQGRRRTRPPH